MIRRQTFQPMTLLFSLLGLIMVLFIALPLVSLVVSISPLRLYETLLESEVWRSILLTLYMGLWTTAIAFCFGIPLAYLLARRDFPGKWFVEGIVDLPLVIPHTASGIALLSVFGRKFYGGKAFGLLGISFVGMEPGIIIAMLFVSVPIMINTVREGFVAVGPRLEGVAQTLGGSPWRVFLTITLPLSRRSILTGMLMMWSRGISEFGAIFILVYHPMVAPVLIWDRFETYGLDYAKPVAVLLIFLCIGIFFLFRWLGLSRSPGGIR
jgi:molybdate/tungstate transport system permease protein